MESYLKIIKDLSKKEDDTELGEPQLVSDMDLVKNDPAAATGPDPVYVGDPQANDVKPRRDNIKLYGRRFQR